MHPDYRFVLANERTFLAYLRTSLALDGAALAVAQFLDLNPRWLVSVLALIMALAGLAAVVGGALRWRSNADAIAGDRPLRTTSIPIGLAAAVGLCAIVAAVLIFG